MITVLIGIVIIISIYLLYALVNPEKF
ncbi:potassium-transporting ATPase subunit F [Cytobacillus horneckiae]|uniref:Potassium-transporting ATPase subunit F n=1 Tax=Cytobacillus horneckiae TaxID=549687 RepID=A0A2N0ZD57_9BACI|nr:potassium-transporting ATPase subunit F [Cytobacillus horneckiae]PKG27442.1 potassium-transporting ATPase subunit F [Cytobacillus horneckiae]